MACGCLNIRGYKISWLLGYIEIVVLPTDELNGNFCKADDVNLTQELTSYRRR